ncbi:MAG: sigma 54-interacting transcriptional regulator [Deltaproteobacteria bacterium]|nr:sigma 54-interacting transcriptional regulator [Deltaproteobacteria bacterium]
MAVLDLPATLLGHESAPGAARYLLVITPESVSRRNLPEEGALTIGRSVDNDIPIDDPMVSRSHAVLHVEPTRLRIQDAGSANGISIRGARVPSLGTAEVVLGVAIDLGGSMLVVTSQSSLGAHRPARLTSHAAFEAKLEEACRRPGSFEILRVRTSGRVDPAVLERALTEVLDEGDLVAFYAPGEYELLLFGARARRGDDVARRIEAELRTPESDVEIGHAQFPRDGRSPESLIEAAGRWAHDFEPPSNDMVAADPATQDLVRIASRVAQGTLSVLLLGETGVGKEVFAELIHKSSPRRAQPFVRVNCAALSGALLESELFGHERGSFTGATESRKGLLEHATGGTVLLDEVGETSPELQAKLLRALEQKEVLRVGGRDPRPIDVRFISATNRDLEAEIQAGHFRSDLFYRLSGVTLEIAPLRDRPRDLESLVQRLLAEASHEASARIAESEANLLAGRTAERLPASPEGWRMEIHSDRAPRIAVSEANLPAGRIHSDRAPRIAVSEANLPAGRIHSDRAPRIPLQLSERAKDLLQSYRWPGNVRELKNVIERAALLCNGSTIEPEHLPVERMRARWDGPRTPRSPSISDPRRAEIIRALEESFGNQARAAEILGVSRRTLTNWLTRYAIPRPRKGAPD